jgi:dihydrofolate synthase/folylpolyglutamate synthase
MNEIESYIKFYNILNSLQPYSIDLSLDRIKLFLKKISNPQNSFKAIIVGGTNGKGSVCQFLTDAFIDAGYTVGTYTSPHLISINERIRINNKPISYNKLYRHAFKLFNYIKDSPLTYYEFLTVLAFEVFSSSNIDFAILEIGMGGEFDAVNVAHPILSILTRISLDHTQHLGKTHEEIAKTKSKIIKNIGVVGKNCKKVINSIKCASKNSELFFVDESYTNKAQLIKTVMSGPVVLENLSTALLSIDVLNEKYNLKIKYSSLQRSFWPGRFEVIKSNRKTYILDGAHNKNAASKLSLGLNLYPGDKILIFSALKQKDWKNNLKILMPHFKKIILTQISGHKLSQKPSAIKHFISKKDVIITENTNSAILKSIQMEEKIVVITGSLYLVAESKACKIYKRFLP